MWQFCTFLIQILRSLCFYFLHSSHPKLILPNTWRVYGAFHLFPTQISIFTFSFYSLLEISWVLYGAIHVSGSSSSVTAWYLTSRSSFCAASRYFLYLHRNTYFLAVHTKPLKKQKKKIDKGKKNNSHMMRVKTKRNCYSPCQKVVLRSKSAWVVLVLLQ